MRYPRNLSKLKGEDRSEVASVVSKALQKLILRVPSSTESASQDPKARSRRLAATAARKASAISTVLSLPPGPLGLVTILPDLKAIWELQSQLVADIAAVYGHSKALTRTSLTYCLFRHGSAALVRDLVVRTGERLVVRGGSVRVLQGLISRLGVRITEQVLGKALSRFIPILGALGVGAYAYYELAYFE